MEERHERTGSIVPPLMMKKRVATHPAKNVVATLTTSQTMEKRYG
jgi:hypothetical protein